MSIASLRALALLLPCAVLGSAEPNDGKPVPMKDVTIRGRAAADSSGGTVDLVIQATIGTPLGRIPINSYLALRYDCGAVFRGRMSYHPLVRLFAKVKGVDLIRSMRGRVEAGVIPDMGCAALPAARITGAASATDMQLSGWLRLGADSVAFRGPAWMAGDTSYHSVLSAERSDRVLVMSVSMYER